MERVLEFLAGSLVMLGVVTCAVQVLMGISLLV